MRPVCVIELQGLSPNVSVSRLANARCGPSTRMSPFFRLFGPRGCAESRSRTGQTPVETAESFRKLPDTIQSVRPPTERIGSVRRNRLKGRPQLQSQCHDCARWPFKGGVNESPASADVSHDAARVLTLVLSYE
jgi:hypothetical protein